GKFHTTKVHLYKKHFRLSGYLSERYHFSRWFAGSRFADEGFVRMSRIRRRVLYLLLTPALPFLILFRLTKRAIARNYARQYLTTLPLIFLFAIVWAVGEFAGYLLGPGQSAHELL
ncbi:MAG: hypothetical protein ACE5GO_08065, partial [Anaerolineales bacterium]